MRHTQNMREGRRSLVGAPGFILGWCALFYAWGRLTFPHGPPLVFLTASGIVCAFSCLLLIFFFARRPVSARMACSFLITGACVNLGLNHFWACLPTAFIFHLYLLLDLSLLGVALGAGCLLARGVTCAGHIIPLVLAAAMADIWSVFRGLTREIVQSAAAMNHLLIHYPVPGHGIRPLIGVMDFAFAALFIALAYKFGLSMKKTLAAMGLSFAATIVLAVLSGAGLPLLPGMGLFFILAHFKNIRMHDSREKKQALAILGLIAALLIFLTALRS